MSNCMIHTGTVCVQFEALLPSVTSIPRIKTHIYPIFMILYQPEATACDGRVCKAK